MTHWEPQAVHSPPGPQCLPGTPVVCQAPTQSRERGHGAGSKGSTPPTMPVIRARRPRLKGTVPISGSDSFPVSLPVSPRPVALCPQGQAGHRAQKWSCLGDPHLESILGWFLGTYNRILSSQACYFCGPPAPQEVFPVTTLFLQVENSTEMLSILSKPHSERTTEPEHSTLQTTSDSVLLELLTLGSIWCGCRGRTEPQLVQGPTHS